MFKLDHDEFLILTILRATVLAIEEALRKPAATPSKHLPTSTSGYHSHSQPAS